MICRIKVIPKFPSGSVVKNPPARAGDAGLIPGSGRSPGERNGNTLHIFAWRIPRTEEPGEVQSVESPESHIQLSD